MVGDIDERGRFPGAGRLGSVGLAGAKLKSVSSLFSRNPRPGTVMPEPPVCSIVRVYATALPHLSTTERWVVERFSVSGASAAAAAWQPAALSGAAATGFTLATFGLMTHARASAKSWLSRVSVGTSMNAGS